MICVGFQPVPLGKSLRRSKSFKDPYPYYFCPIPLFRNKLSSVKVDHSKCHNVNVADVELVIEIMSPGTLTSLCSASHSTE
jgi:hypothetical protein